MRGIDVEREREIINNGFPNYIVATEIKRFINKTEQYKIDNTLNHKLLLQKPIS